MTSMATTSKAMQLTRAAFFSITSHGQLLCLSSLIRSAIVYTSTKKRMTFFGWGIDGSKTFNGCSPAPQTAMNEINCWLIQYGEWSWCKLQIIFLSYYNFMDENNKQLRNKQQTVIHKSKKWWVQCTAPLRYNYTVKSRVPY